MPLDGTLFFIYSPSLYQNSQTPNGMYVVQASTLLSKRPNVRTVNISDLGTASVCFIREESHNIPCVLNGGRMQVFGACPVTTECIVAMS